MHDDAAILDLVLAKLDGVRQHAGYWMARCPAHDDGRASLSVARGTSQPVVLNCKAGCATMDVLAAIGLSAADISRPRDPADPGDWHGDPVTAWYTYADEQGTVLFQVCRTAGKQFPQRRPDPAGRDGWSWGLKGVRRVPYHLPQLVAAVAARRTVYVAEGEKDVRAIEAAGGTATCNPGGAGKWRDEYGEWFRGADVIVVADADKPGREHAADVAARLRGIARSVKVAEPAEGKDAADHLAAGHSLAELAVQRPPGRVLAVVDLEPASEHVPSPELICRDLLYAGGVHTLTGPPDSGKTTLACWWMLQAVRDGYQVLFLDEEGGRDMVVEKFQALGARPGERIGYIQFPSRTWDAGDIAMLNDILDERKPALVAWDSSAAFLARAGLDENAAADITRFYSRVLIPAARSWDAAVLVLDHDTKNSEPSRYARGSGAKLAATDVAYKIIPVQPFSKTENGTSKLLVTKDRRGWLARSHEVGFCAQHAGAASLAVTISGAAAASLARLAPAEQNVLDALDTIPQTIGDLGDRIAAVTGRGLRRPTITRALGRLRQLGLAEQSGKAVHADLWKICG